MFKSNKGFTLVELIVVIAILAILAGVAIPVYNGYIKRANDAAVVTELDSIMTAAQAANATQGQIVKVVLEEDGKTIKVAGKDNILASDFDANFVLFQGGAQDASANSVGVFTLKNAVKIENTSYEDGATWTVENGKWEADAQDVPDQSIPGDSNPPAQNPENPEEPEVPEVPEEPEVPEVPEVPEDPELGDDDSIVA